MPTRYAHVKNPNPEPSVGWYAEVRDLVHRVDPKRGFCEWWSGKSPGQGGGSWHVRMGRHEALFPYRGGSALEGFYTGQRTIMADRDTREFKEDVIHILSDLMRNEKYRYPQTR
jgi:hypothetical protein